MTRKHYVAIAAAIRDQMPTPYVSDDEAADTLDGEAYGRRQASIAIARKAADLFAADNPRFDRGRFMRACTGQKVGAEQ